MPNQGSVCIVLKIIFQIILLFPLAITSIVLGANSSKSCDITDPMGLNVGTYLIINGTVSIITTIICIALNIFLLFGCKNNFYVWTFYLVILLCIFGFCWFIVGAVILFRSNIECINKHSVHVIFALVMWCISAFNILQNCCDCGTNNDNVVQIP